MTDNTPNHNYNLPDRGAQDWDVALNENFSNLDVHVENRDSEANKGDYQPGIGAKFLAVDTGNVYIGDGSEWNPIGGIGSGGLTAVPGQVQTFLDTFSSGHQWGPQPMETISLIPGETYEISDTWVLSSGTRLDFNGAVVRPQGDFDVLKLQRDTYVNEPRINVSDVDGYSSVCIDMAADSGKIGSPNPAQVNDCHLFNDGNTGVGLRFRGTSNPVSLQRASGIIHNFDIALEFRSEGSGSGSNDGWCNGNRFDGSISGSTIPIYLNSTNGSPVSGNTVRGQVQCASNTEWVVRQEDASGGTALRGNTYIIQVWDDSKISNGFEDASNRDPPRAPIWYIGSGQQEYNSLRSLTGSHSNEFIVNRSTTGDDRNAIFNGIGDTASRGTVEFDHPSTFASNDAPFHPES